MTRVDGERWSGLLYRPVLNSPMSRAADYLDVLILLVFRPG